MVLPCFDYLDVLIYSSPKKHIDKLQMLQFRGIKIIYQYNINGCKIKNSNEDRLHAELGLVFLRNRRRRHLLNMIYSLV